MSARVLFYTIPTGGRIARVHRNMLGEYVATLSEITHTPIGSRSRVISTVYETELEPACQTAMLMMEERS